MPDDVSNDARDLVRLYGTMTAGPVRLRFAVTFRPPRRMLDDDGWPLPDFKRAIVALLPLDRLELKTDPELLDALMAMDRRTPVRFRVDRVRMPKFCLRYAPNRVGEPSPRDKLRVALAARGIKPARPAAPRT